MTLAQLTNPVLPVSIGAGSYTKGGTAFGMLISNIIGLLFIIAFILAFLYLLVGGISWITAGGDKTKLEQARDKITNAIIGLIVVAAAWAVMLLVGQFVGINVQQIRIPTI